MIKVRFLPDASVSLQFRKYHEGLYPIAEINQELILAFWVWAGHLSGDPVLCLKTARMFFIFLAFSPVFCLHLFLIAKC